jgi:hypothetical protein
VYCTRTRTVALRVTSCTVHVRVLVRVQCTRTVENTFVSIFEDTVQYMYT